MSKFSCTVCDLTLNSQEQYEDHVIGQKHLKKLHEAEANIPDTSTSTYDILPNGHYICNVCNKVCAGKIPYMEHVQGQSHQKALKIKGSESVASPSSPSSAPQPLTTGRLQSDADTSSVGEFLAHGRIRCKVCIVDCTGMEPFRAHVEGQAHQKALKFMKGSVPVSPISRRLDGESSTQPGESEVEKSAEKTWKHAILCEYK